MSQEAKTTAFVKKFNSLMDSVISPKSLSHLAYLLNDISEVTDRVKQVFYHYLNHYDHLKIKKCLEIFEFLTFHSNTQLIPILVDEKFIELLPYALSDDDLQEPALNLLKLWTDKYREEKHDMAPIFDCIDGLSAFGIFLPSSYTSKYEGSVLEPPEPEAQEEKPQPPAANSLAEHVKSKITSIMERANVLRDESRSLLDDNTFQYLPDEYRKEHLEGLLGSHRQLAMEKSGMRLDGAGDELKSSIEALFIVLKAQEKKLSNMFEKLDKKEPDSPESVTSVETNGDHYRIVISGAEDKQQGFSTAMTRDEFNDYKVYPCQKGVDCPYFSDPEIFSEQERNYHELQCPGWHSSHDKRRSVENEAGDRKYYSNLCIDLPSCNENDACDFCHNFFEKVFHPTNYKKNKCGMKADQCLNGKYCPHYHSRKEKESWKFGAKNISFASNSDNNSDASFGDYESKALEEQLEQFWGKKGHDDIEGLSSGFHLPREVIIPFNMGSRARENIESVVSKKGEEANRLKELEEVPAQVEMKGNLNGKLIVRKSYNDPSVLTSFFSNSACFNFMPFVATKQTVQSAQESPQEGEQPRHKVKQEVMSDEARAVTISI